MYHLIGYLTSHLPGRALCPDRGDTGTLSSSSSS